MYKKLISKGEIYMDKQYVYRKHLRHPLKYLITLLLFFIIVYVACAATFILTSKDMDRGLGITIFSIVGAIVLGIIMVEFIVIYFVFLRRFKKISISLTEEGIIYNNINGITRVPYEEISSLNFPSIRYVGGWIKIMYGKGNIKLTVVLENIGDFLKNLRNKLDEMNFEYDEKKMYNFYKTAEFSDQSWARVYDYIKWLILFIILNVAISALFISLGMETSLAFLLIMCSILLPAIVFVIAEAIIGGKLARGASMESFSVPDRDKRYELSVYKWTFGTYAILYLIANIYLLVK